MRASSNGPGGKASFRIVLTAAALVVLASTAKAQQSITIYATIPSECGNELAEFDEQCDGSDLRGRSCATFGYSDEPGFSCTGSCGFDFSACLTDAEAFSQETFATSTGGTHIHDNSDGTQAIFDFPAGYYSKELTLRVFSYVTDYFAVSKPAPSTYEFAGKVYDFFLNDYFGARVETLSEEVTATIDYREEDIPAGFDESDLAPFRWGLSDSAWQAITFLLNVVDNRVSFSTTNPLGSFSLLVPSPVPTPSPSPSPTPAGAPPQAGQFATPPPFTPAPPPLIEPCTPPDFSCDGRVNIVDLSILLYWWGKTGPDIAYYDLNKDGRIDIVDASILLYYWSP